MTSWLSISNIKILTTHIIARLRVEELLEGVGRMDEEWIRGILMDHGVDGEPSDNTICRHGDVSSSLRSMIFYPRLKKMKLLYGHLCQNEYEEFTFS